MKVLTDLDKHWPRLTAFVLSDLVKRDDAPFHPTAVFRTIACAYEDAGSTGVHAACTTCIAEERLKVAEAALELVVGLAEPWHGR